MSGAKYFVLGFVFYFLISLFLYWLWRTGYSYNTFFPLFTGLIVGIVVAVGLFKGPKAGLVFGSAYFLADLASFLIFYSRFFSYYLSVMLFSSFIMALIQASYGYFPSRFYERQQKISIGFVGFFIALIGDFFFSLFASILDGYPRLLDRLFWVFILGSLSIILCVNRLKLQKRMLSPSLHTETTLPLLQEKSGEHDNISRQSLETNERHTDDWTTTPLDVGEENTQVLAGSTPMQLEEAPQQLSGVLILPDNSELSIGANRTMGRGDLAKCVSQDRMWWISKQHFTIFQEQRLFYIEDNGSTNGTKLNGTEIRNKGKQKLNDGDEILVADIITLVFKRQLSEKMQN
jgi:hypothetical protein